MILVAFDIKKSLKVHENMVNLSHPAKAETRGATQTVFSKHMVKQTLTLIIAQGFTTCLQILTEST